MRVLISFLFILQATHESTASAGNLCRIHREALFLDHLHELAGLAGAVEQRVVGVAVEMDEGLVAHGRWKLLVYSAGTGTVLR